VQTFATVQSAKDFLISRIIAQAQREHVSLSDLEVRMLSYSEIEGSQDFEELNDAFEQQHDTTEYEGKIGELARSFIAQVRKENSEDLCSWKQAVQTLKREDHYLAVLIADETRGTQDSPLTDRLKLIAVALGITLLISIGASVFAMWQHPTP
jgi:hypothetical protein